MKLNAARNIDRGMTLVEVMVASAIFTLILISAFGALTSVRNLSKTALSQVELQEEARSALEKITKQIQNAGRFTDAGNKPYPVLFKENGGIPKGYDSANSHPPKNNSKAKPGSNVNGGDPTLPSDEIIFKIPQMGPNGLPLLNGNEIVWSKEEYGFFIVPAADGTNHIEFRNSAVSKSQGKDVEGELVARFADRLQFHTQSTDPSLTSRQIRVTVYLTRVIQRDGAPSILTVSLSSVVDMRNSSQME